MSADPRDVLAEAAGSGRAVRVHTRDGEVLVARVLECGPEELVYAVITSSRPERYAVCDSTGFTLPLQSVERAEVLARAPALRRAVLVDTDG